MLFFDKPDLFGKDLHLLFVFYQLLYLYIYFYYNALKMLVLNMYMSYYTEDVKSYLHTKTILLYYIKMFRLYIQFSKISHKNYIYIYIYNLDPKKEKKTRLWDKLCYKRTMIINTKDDSIDLKYVQNLILYKKPHHVFNNSIPGNINSIINTAADRRIFSYYFRNAFLAIVCLQ